MPREAAGDQHAPTVTGHRRDLRDAGEQPVDVVGAGVRRDAGPHRTRVAQADPPRRLDRVEVAGRRVDAELGQVLVDLRGPRGRRPRSTRSGYAAAGWPCSVTPSIARSPSSSRANSRSSASSTTRIDASTRVPPGGVARRGGREPGDEVDRRGGPGEHLVGQRAELEPLGHRDGRGQQLVGARSARAPARWRRRRRGAARRTCTASTRRSRRPSRRRRSGRAGSGARRRRRAAHPPRARPRRSRGCPAGCRGRSTPR